MTVHELFPDRGHGECSDCQEDGVGQLTELLFVLVLIFGASIVALALLWDLWDRFAARRSSNRP